MIDVEGIVRMWSVVLLLTVGGCAASGESARPAPSVSAAADCGTFVLRQGERLPATAMTCLTDAVETGRPARLRVTSPTTEGDPIQETYESAGTGLVRLTRDSREDSYGWQGVRTELCTGITADRGRLTAWHCGAESGPPYEAVAQDAAARGWAVDHVPGRHLHQLVDPGTVTATITEMVRAW